MQHDIDAIVTQIHKALSDTLATTPHVTENEHMSLVFYNLKNEEYRAELQIADGTLMMFEMRTAKELTQRERHNTALAKMASRDEDETAAACRTLSREPSPEVKAYYERMALQTTNTPPAEKHFHDRFLNPPQLPVDNKDEQNK